MDVDEHEDARPDRAPHRTAMTRVIEFHKAFGLPVAPIPSSLASRVDDDLSELRQRLLQEEVDELREAVGDRDLVAIAHELADVVYVAYGTAITYGIDLDAIVAEVHRANMSKLDNNGRPVMRRDGKILKGPRYQRPNVQAVLEAQASLDAATAVEER